MSVLQKKFISLHRGIFRNAFWAVNPRFITKPSLNRTEQVDFIKSLVETNKSELNWLDVKNNILCKPGTLNEKNIDAVILKVMVTDKKFNAALSFANYLKSSEQELSLGAINGVLSLYYVYSKEYELSDSDKEFILNSYRNLYSKYKILDNTTGERLLHALCSINEYKKSMKVLDDILLSATPTHSAYSTLIGTLFRNNKKVEAVKMIEKSVNNNRPLQDYAYEQWIEYIFRKYKDKQIILKYLNELCTYISNNSAIVPVVTAQRLKDAFQSIKWVIQFTEIRKHRGECESCNMKLNCLRLSKEEFSMLQQNVKQKLIVGSDLFLKTSPDELKKFTEFVANTAPYDIVLDALNIAYTIGKGDVNSRIRVLTVVVNYFLEQNKKILLLGRKHMLNWRRGSLHNLMKKTHNFFTEDISQDDPYFISAAILSGPQTDIVSRDLFRGHRFIMQDQELRQLFQRWQWEHQWMVFSAKFKPIIQAPLKFTPIAQQNNKGWHVPYDAEDISTSGQLNDGYPDITKWLCIRPKSN